MQGILSAAWRWATDECPGGQKTTAICVKLSVAVLVTLTMIGFMKAPVVVTKVLEISKSFDELVEFKNQLKPLTDAMALQNVREEAHEAEQTRRLDNHARLIMGLNAEMDGVEKDVVRLQGDMTRAQGDIRYLNENTVKAGRR